MIIFILNRNHCSQKDQFYNDLNQQCIVSDVPSLAAWCTTDQVSLRRLNDDSIVDGSRWFYGCGEFGGTRGYKSVRLHNNTMVHNGRYFWQSATEER